MEKLFVVEKFAWIAKINVIVLVDKVKIKLSNWISQFASSPHRA